MDRVGVVRKAAFEVLVDQTAGDDAHEVRPFKVADPTLGRTGDELTFTRGSRVLDEVDAFPWCSAVTPLASEVCGKCSTRPDDDVGRRGWNWRA